jgi:hypothetical protein
VGGFLFVFVFFFQNDFSPAGSGDKKESKKEQDGCLHGW